MAGQVLPRAMQMSRVVGMEMAKDDMEDDFIGGMDSMTAMASIGPLGGMAGVSMRGMRGMRGRGRSERQSALAARVANLVDEHSHGLLMQMLQVCIYARSLPCCCSAICCVAAAQA